MEPCYYPPITGQDLFIILFLTVRDKGSSRLCRQTCVFPKNVPSLSSVQQLCNAVMHWMPLGGSPGCVHRRLAYDVQRGERCGVWPVGRSGYTGMLAPLFVCERSGSGGECH